MMLLTRYGTLLISVCLVVNLAEAQQTLDFSGFQQQVLNFHPLSLRANLLRDQAAALQLRARGGFDPKLNASYTDKSFNGKQYFQYADAGIKLPTWAGLELKGAYNYTSGIFLNPESQLPANGQANFGIEWALGQGLFFDERRAGLQMARIAQQMNEAERLALQNDLLLEAGKTYWNWVLAQSTVTITRNVLEQAQIRHQGIVESFFQGDKPGIDTVESFLQVQSRLLDQRFAQIEAQNAAIALRVYLWNQNQEVLSLEELPAAPPLNLSNGSLFITLNVENFVAETVTRHPEIQFYQSKMKQLAVERRLKNEKRKPVVNASYYLLGDGWSFFSAPSAQGPSVLVNDIKWGLDISYPLLNRKARGDYQLTQIKLKQTELELQQKIQSVSAKVRQYANDLSNLRDQVSLFEGMTENYRRLLEAENEKFQQGESSIFLINTREQRWLDAQIKLLKLYAELYKAEASLRWAMGNLAQ